MNHQSTKSDYPLSVTNLWSHPLKSHWSFSDPASSSTLHQDDFESPDGCSEEPWVRGRWCLPGINHLGPCWALPSSPLPWKPVSSYYHCKLLWEPRRTTEDGEKKAEKEGTPGRHLSCCGSTLLLQQSKGERRGALETVANFMTNVSNLIFGNFRQCIWKSL